ncbi:MAG: hypothetical protein KDD40_11055 [Bdellovibrionales bacterium]|nr:hypothetical protein [Bdellovibrionales bacterium]
MEKYTLIFLILISPYFTQAADKDKKEEHAPLVEPYIGYEAGRYETETKIDKGSYSALGVGFRAGYNFPFLFIGGEAFFSLPNLGSENNLTGATREAYFLAEDSSVNYGLTIIIKLGALQLYGTGYYESTLNGTVENENPLEPDGDYRYYEIGAKASLELRLFRGLSIGAGYFTYNYDKYSLNNDVNTLTKTKKTDRPTLDITGYIFTLNYNIPLNFNKK